MPRVGLRLDTGPQLDPSQLLELVRLAEDRGYECVWVPEGNGRDAMSQLTAFAAATTRIRVGTGILPVFTRTPTLLAMSAGGLDAISQKRFILGLGVGHKASVENGQGISFSQPMTRLRETVEVVRRLLKGERVSLEGRVYNFSNATLGFDPVRPDIPIYLAALGPQMLELAGEIADGALMTWAAPGYLKTAAYHLRLGAERAGRNPDDVDLASYIRVAVVDNLDQVRPAMQREIANYCSRPFYKSYFDQEGFPEEAAAIARAWSVGDANSAAEAVTDDMIRQLAVFGTAEECRTQVEARRAMGLKQPVIGPYVHTDNPMKCYRDAVEAFSG